MVAVASHGSTAALRFGTEAAARWQAPLHLVHVVALAPGPGAPRSPATETLEMIHRGHRVLDTACGTLRSLARVPATTELAHGSVVGRIVAAAGEHDLTVLQRDGDPGARSGEADVSPQVAALAPGPVACVPSTWTETTGRGTVVVGVGEPSACGPLLQQALAAAGERAAGLRIVHGTAAGEDPALVRSRIEDVPAALPVGLPAVPVTIEVLPGRPGKVLRDASYGAELLVLGRHRPHWVHGSSLGSVARALICDPVCPVLLTVP